MASRRNFLAILVAAGAIGGAIWGVGMRPGGLSLPGARPDPVTVTLASAVTKAEWIAAGVAAFGAAGITTADGRPIVIETSNVLSGDSMLQIAAQTLQPVAWSPGETPGSIS